MFLLIPSADVKITVASRETEQDIAFQVSRNITEVDNLRNIVPATVITQEFEKTQEFETQGRRVEGTKAEGVVILYNEQRAVQPLLPRTRLRLDGTDLIFRTQAAVRIPPATNAGPGTIEVGVDPDIEGSETNAKEGQRFTVVNLSGFLQERVYARAKSDFSGGTTTNIPQVSQSEIDEAKNTLTEALVSESLNSMREQEENDQYIITNGSWWTEAKDVSVSNAVGDEVDKFTVTAKVEVNVLTFKQSDLASLIENDFADNLDDGQRLARQKFTDLQITNLDQFKGDAELNGKVKFLVKNDIDLDEIKNEIAGKTKLDAEDILQDMVPGMQEIQRFSISPDWSSNMPILTSRINITVQEIAQEESAL
jgi:hypothetical protein